MTTMAQRPYPQEQVKTRQDKPSTNEVRRSVRRDKEQPKDNSMSEENENVQHSFELHDTINRPFDPPGLHSAEQ